jgi:hypothetical protein
MSAGDKLWNGSVWVDMGAMKLWNGSIWEDIGGKNYALGKINVPSSPYQTTNDTWSGGSITGLAFTPRIFFCHSRGVNANGAYAVSGHCSFNHTDPTFNYQGGGGNVVINLDYSYSGNDITLTYRWLSGTYYLNAHTIYWWAME